MTRRVKFGLTLAALIGFAAVYLLLRPGLRPSEQAQEVGAAKGPSVAASALEMRDGRLYLLGSATPFTGLREERYPDGALRARIAYRDGVQHGPAQGWHNSGERHSLQYYAWGTAHGRQWQWDVAGRLNRYAEYREGALDGLFARWDGDGHLMHCARYSRGQPHGISEAYYPDGSVRARVEMRLGAVVARETFAQGAAQASIAAFSLPPDNLEW